MKMTLAPRVDHLEASATEELENAVKRMQVSGVDDILSLGVGEPCFDTPRNIVLAAQEALSQGVTKYQPTAGAPELREAIANKLRSQNRIPVGVDEVLVTPGAKFAVYLAFQAVLEPGDSVLLLDPSWVSYADIATLMGAGVVRVETKEMEGYQPDPEAVHRAWGDHVRLVVVNSPCNPTGAAYDKTSIRAIAELALTRGAYLLSDEIYERLLFEGEPYSPASEFSHVITVNGFSKTYAMTGWRLGYVTAPREVLQGMLKLCQHSTSCVTAFAQAGAVAALRAEESEAAVREMLDGYRRRRAKMLDVLSRSESLHCREAQGAFYCFASYDFDRQSVQLARALLEHVHVATVPGAAFGPCGENHLRLSYAGSEDVIGEALSRIEDRKSV